MNEFDLIERYFGVAARRLPRRAALGIGDDCALLAPRPGHQLAVSTDMLVAGRHFLADVDPASLGWKTLAVNLSDLAAMGASPLGFTLALALPAVDAAWLSGFAAGLFECAQAFDCELVGGDTTRGPLTLCVTVFGDVADGAALRRDAARPGDDVWVSGSFGRAALALRRLRSGDTVEDDLRAALERPVPRVALGLALAGLAHAAIDVSDGLAQDLGHVLAASRCAATLDVDAIPADRAVRDSGDDQHRTFTLAGGDDYELCFTAPATRRDAVEVAGLTSGTPVTRVGAIADGSGLRLVDADGADWRGGDAMQLGGYDHFA